MDEREVFVLADETLQRVIGQIRGHHWDQPVPEDFPRSQTDQRPTLREIVNYHAYDDAWVPDMLAGRTMDEAGRHRFDGDLLGEEPIAAFDALVAKACEAVRSLDDLERVVHCSFGDFAAREYLWQITSFRALRAHDIARVVGVAPDLSEALVRGVWDEISPHAEEWRAMGVFPPAVPVADGAPLLDRLLGLTGRQP